jgi:hypothetical protein
MITFPHPDASLLCQRLQQRGSVISHTEPAEMQRFIVIAAELGSLLRVAREYVENALPQGIIDPTVQWLWEQGLALPEEVTDGQIGTLLHAYTTAILSQQDVSAHQRLSVELGVLRAALGETFPSASAS